MFSAQPVFPLTTLNVTFKSHMTNLTMSWSKGSLSSVNVIQTLQEKQHQIQVDVVDVVCLSHFCGHHSVLCPTSLVASESFLNMLDVCVDQTLDQC